MKKITSLLAALLLAPLLALHAAGVPASEPDAPTFATAESLPRDVTNESNIY